MTIGTEPRTLADPTEVERRNAMLFQPHIAPLIEFVQQLRKRDTNEYPFFDPLDAGVNAEILFLFEKPGPMTVPKGRLSKSGSGFISRDNDDPTAEATFSFMEEAEIPRSKSVIWNTVPCWNGRRKILQNELEDGIRDLRSLLPLLPDVKKIVLVGRKAERAKSLIQRGSQYQVFTSAHPSPLVKASYREKWDLIPEQWRKAWHYSSN